MAAHHQHQAMCFLVNVCVCVCVCIKVTYYLIRYVHASSLESLMVDLSATDNLAQFYRATVLLFNTTDGEYYPVYSRDGLKADDFPIGVPYGVARGYHYVSTVESVVDDERRQSLSFETMQAMPICKYI